MTSSLPDGFRFRAAGDDDSEIAARIVVASEKSLRGRADYGAPELDVFWRHASLDGGRWMVEDADGMPAAFAIVRRTDDDAISWAAVHPDFRGRGLATALIEEIEQRARSIGARVLKAGTYAEDTAARELLERRGYREARRYYHMRLDLDGPPAAPTWPDGVTVSTFRPENARAFHAALDEAFAEEWGFFSIPFEEWKRRRLESPETDTSLWFVARDGDEIAGVARCSREENGGWIGALGVRKAWRNRGIGLALLRHAFAEFHRRGEQHVNLGVDSENPTGATRLYERAGMRVLSEDVVFEKELS